MTEKLPPRPLNYSTRMPVNKSTDHVVEQLRAHGASAIGLTYQDGSPCGLHFVIDTAVGPQRFAVPVNVTAMHTLLNRLRKARQIDRDAFTSYDHAARVAWAQVRDWLTAQLALIQTGMVQLDEVMLPYLTDNDGVTLYKRYIDTRGGVLTAGPDR